MPDPDDEEDEESGEGGIAAAFAAFGLVPEGELDPDDGAEFFLWPENLDVFRFWLTLQSQWRCSDEGRRLGLEYQGVQICLAHWLDRKKQRQEYFWLVQAMESAVIVADADRN